MWWYILGVNPDDDEKTIKKAYAKLIKEVNQDHEIEKFTNLHNAYRQAMQSFKNNRNSKSGLLMYEGVSGWYLEELNNIYSNPSKRIDCSAWQNLFACMSFVEEEEFLVKYVDFFNEHYLLINEVWQLVEQHYPLSNHKSFKWRELCNGNFSLSLTEIEEMTPEKAEKYVDFKVKCFYHILNNSFEQAMEIIKPMVVEFGTSDIIRWYLVCSYVLVNESDFREAYQLLIKFQEHQAFADYYSEHYCWATRDINEIALKELSEISRKDKKMLGKGKYTKSTSTDFVQEKKKFIWGGR